MNGEAAQRRSWTPDEYLAMERSSPEKHEYCDGKVFAMASANEKHNLIVGNVVTALNVATEPQPGSGRRLRERPKDRALPRRGGAKPSLVPRAVAH